MEERYWELREQVERSFDKWMGNRTLANAEQHEKDIIEFMEFCTDVLNQLMEENSDVLKRLKER